MAWQQARSDRSGAVAMRHKVCFETVIEFYIRLIQTGVDRFTVQYGQQFSDGLNYGSAAKELGESMMHALACQGHLDNSERKR